MERVDCERAGVCDVEACGCEASPAVGAAGGTAGTAGGSRGARADFAAADSVPSCVGTFDGASACVGDEASSAEPDPALALLRRFRRDLHRIPELDFDLPRTIAYVEGVLGGLSCEITHPCRSCVCAFFAAEEGAVDTVAIRADMDALPIAEATGAAFVSETPGRMHACGHDAHMAMALVMAVEVDRVLAEEPGALVHNVLFVFQPAEETTGGAKTVCESGVFERYGASRIFGFHVWPDLPAGTVASRPGALLARSSETHIHIHGESLHIGKTLGMKAADSHDAALAAARFLVAESELMELLGAGEPCIARFGLVEAGTVCNAVAGEAHIAGSVRVFSDAMFERVRAELIDALERVCVGVGCTYDVDFAEGYPPVTNDPALFEQVAAVLPGLSVMPEPLLIAEDFAFYQRHLPGVFFLLGCGEPQAGADSAPDAPANAGACSESTASSAVAQSPCAGDSASVADATDPASVDNPRDAQGCPTFATSALHTDTMLFDERCLVTGLNVYRRLLGLA